jgi:DNA polymerase III epsilon subunit-like protein
MKTMQKHPLNPRRLRRVPSRFSWVDHRLVRHRLLSRAGPSGCALYLFLVTVGDEQGLSYYSDNSVCGHLGISAQALHQARRDLLACDLIAWEAPLYQVLALNTEPCPVPGHDADACVARASQPARTPTEPVNREEGRAESLRLAETLSQILKGGAR